jgi:hypothetical protein
MTEQLALNSILEIDMNYQMGLLTLFEYAGQIHDYWLWLVDNGHDVHELLEGKLCFPLSVFQLRTNPLPAEWIK